MVPTYDLSSILNICKHNMHDTLQQKPQACKLIKIIDKQARLEEVLMMVL